MYSFIQNPITRGQVSINSDLGKTILSNFINCYQKGGEPCTNCGNSGHNMRTCKLP